MEENERETAASHTAELVEDPVPQTEQFAGEPLSEKQTGKPYGEATNRSVFTAQEPHINSVPQPKQTNPLSTAGLVCGIIGIVTSFIPILNFVMGSILGILAVVFGAIAKKQDGSGMAGIIMGSITLGILVLWVIILMVVMIIGATAEGTTF